jgi:hypothetical protein
MAIEPRRTNDVTEWCLGITARAHPARGRASGVV